VTAPSSDLIVSENIFNSKGLSVDCDPGVTGMVVVNNSFANRHTLPPNIPGAVATKTVARPPAKKSPAVSQ